MLYKVQWNEQRKQDQQEKSSVLLSVAVVLGHFIIAITHQIVLKIKTIERKILWSINIRVSISSYKLRLWQN